MLDECEGPRNMNKLDESYVLLKKSESSSQDLVRIDRHTYKKVDTDRQLDIQINIQAEG